ncbi:hypothetical protein LWP59_13780 [Amycolatopsis acidiphila]|uniref:Uncharacterized protein n=1 Tax=Amycolatopsis acidiphila TaxID=715473 RepID=A0A558AJ26_9PSEU|nr:hypothetical protein [Amycolatopsis acidiphila]TVT24249.1 hypothetical protein FNH06_06675 [Amycolatopsis acidiphila]UIJ62620.1 hypothetical protein LWP59_13780 [Amycolatopsis acidiphila]GHG85804.1 hypothetical protein GCM10017788_58740 [Amycolatopsis acidiphila]
MRYRLLFGIACLALVAAPPTATAQGAAKPVLRQAQLEVTPAPQARTVTVTESITVDGVAAGSPIRHLVATFPGVRITGLRVSAGSAVVPTATATGAGADTISFPAPHAGPLSYDIAYTVEQRGGEQVPILVPNVPTDGSRVVRLRYHVPDGYHVQGEPFPVVIGSSGTQQRDLAGMPSFLAYRLGERPSSGWGFASWAGVLIILLGVAFSAVVMLRETRARKG